MTSLRLAVPATLLLTLAGVKPRPVMQQRASHAWIQEVPFGRGAFQESWSPGRIPLALQPVIGPESRLWMVGGRGVWSSVDGIDWTLVTARLPWGDRYGATTVFFRGELWSIAGEEEHVKLNDVFHSRDGKAWEKAARPPWSPRRWHSATVFRDRLWIIGGEGEGSGSDVWATADGAIWEQVSGQVPWPRRGRHATAVWRNRLCVLGGGDFSRPLRDVWCSTDGRTWTMVASQTPWTPRIGAGVAVWDDRLWVFGGSAAGRSGDASWLNDVWSSSDGLHWELHTANAPWTPRAAEYHIVFRDRIWIFGGKGIEARNRGGFADDVWTLGRTTE